MLCQLQMRQATQDSPSQPHMSCDLSASQVRLLTGSLSLLHNADEDNLSSCTPSEDDQRPSSNSPSIYTPRQQGPPCHSYRLCALWGIHRDVASKCPMPTPLTPAPLRCPSQLQCSASASNYPCARSPHKAAASLNFSWAFCLTAANSSCQANAAMQAVFCQFAEAEPKLANLQGRPCGSEQVKGPSPVHQYNPASNCCASKPWKPQSRCAQCQLLLNHAAQPCGAPCLSCPSCRICKPGK